MNKKIRKQRVGLQLGITGVHIMLGLMIVWTGSVTSIDTSMPLIYILMVSTILILIWANKYRNTREWYLTHKSILAYVLLTVFILLFGPLYTSYKHVGFDNFISLYLPILLLLMYIAATSFSANALGSARTASRSVAVLGRMKQTRMQLSLCINLGVFAYNAIVTSSLSSDTGDLFYAIGLFSVLALSGVAAIVDIVFCFKISGWISKLVHAGLAVFWLWCVGWTLLAIAFIGY